VRKLLTQGVPGEYTDRAPTVRLRGSLPVRDVTDEDEEQLIIEPITWLDGSPVRQRRRLGAPAWSGKLGRQGMLALGEGLALLGCFSLPWFSMNDLLLGGRSTSGPFIPSVVSFNGWSIAGGMPFGNGPTGQIRADLFVHLWLVPLAAAALLVVTWAHGRSRLSARLAAGAILALSTLSLLVVLGYYVQVTSLASLMVGPSGSTTLIGVAWGCWLAAGVSAVAMVAAASGLRLSQDGEATQPAD
jgi:hypothetical protein